MENQQIEQIITGCKDGRAESFSMLVDIYSNRLYGYFYRLTGNRDVSDDLLSELFVKLVEKIGRYKSGHFDSWLFKVASNVFYDNLRILQREKELLNARKEQLESEQKKNKISDLDGLDKLQQQLDKLDNETRELLMLRFYSQLSFKEISQMRSEPIGTTLSKVHRGLKKLKELMGAKL